MQNVVGNWQSTDIQHCRNTGCEHVKCDGEIQTPADMQGAKHAKWQMQNLAKRIASNMMQDVKMQMQGGGDVQNLRKLQA